MFTGPVALTTSAAGNSKAGGVSVSQYKLGSEEAFSYQRTGAGVNLIMIKPISFPPSTEEETDGCVHHRLLFFFFFKVKV